MKVKPAPGLKIRDPKTKKHISDEGHEVMEPISTFWHRRIQCGDVVKVDEASAPKPFSKKKDEA